MGTFFTKPAILDQIGDTHCVIEASAGTGKTYTLEHIVVDLLIKGIPPDKILLVTFTTKATLELKIRIQARLETIVEAIANNQLPENAPTDAQAWEITDSARLFLQRAITNFNQITISTIHGFCQQVLKDAAFEDGNLFQQKVVFGNDTFNKVFKTLIRTRFAKSDAEKTIFFKAIATLGSVDKLGELLRTAITERMYLNLPNIKTLQTTLESFPVAAAKALIQEIQDYQTNRTKTGYTYGPMLSICKNAKISGSSYRAMSNRLEQILSAIELCQKTQTAGLFWSEVTSIELQYLQDKFTACNKTNDPTNTITSLAKSCSDLLLQAYDFKAVIVATLLPAVVEALTKYKKQEGLLDFDDMIVLLHQLITSQQGTLFIKRLRERFHIALIDEFQDTDNLQWDIFRTLFLDSDKHRLIVVGDPKQAIYGFRNGDLPTYLTAVATIQAVTGQQPINLATNFRSTKELIAVQNHLFQGNNQTPFFTGKNAGLPKSTICGRPELALHDNQGNSLAPIQLIDSTSEAQEALTIPKAIAINIALAIQETIKYSRLNGNPIMPEDIMVLTNSAKEGLEIANALNTIGVPHTFFKQNGLFNTIEAEHLRDLFLAIDDPMDSNRRAKVLLGPFFHCTFNEIEHYRELANDHPIIKMLLLWQKLILTKQYDNFFYRLVTDSGITQRLLLFNKDKRPLINILHLIELLQQELTNGFYTPLDLATKLQCWLNGTNWPNVEDADIQRLESLTGAVQILTIHKAKGLEALVVAVYGGLTIGGRQANLHRYHDQQNQRKVWVGSLKFASDDVRRLVEDEVTEDYQRLLYVALTRAKAKLILPRILSSPSILSDHNEAHSTTSKRKGAYECINQQLLTLPASMVSNYINVTHKPLAKDHEGNAYTNHQNVKLTWPVKLQLPNFSELVKANRPIWRLSYTYINKELNNLKYQSNYQPYLAVTDNSKHTTLTDYQTPLSGARLGNVVHKLLQTVPLDSFQACTLEQWLTNPTIINLLQAETTPLTYQTVVNLVYQAMTAPLELPNGELVIISRLKQILREMSFVTKYPGQEDILQGSLDIVFQLHGKIYILDWKTNQLDAYDQNTLEITITNHYLLQIKLYTIVICRFLKITSEDMFNNHFGGIVYVFLKGLPTNGVWTLKPSWADLQNWTSELKQLPISNLIPTSAGGNKIKN